MIFCLPPSLSGRGTKRCSQAKTGASSIDFRVSFAKEVLLGMALGDFFMLQIFGTPSLPAPGTKRCHQARTGATSIDIRGPLVKRHC